MELRVKCAVCAVAMCLVLRAGSGMEHKFRYYTDNSGLSSNTIQCLYQDDKGYVWVGTADGLVGFRTRVAIGRWQEKNGLPAACRTFLDLHHQHPAVGQVRVGQHVHEVACEGVDHQTAVAIGRRFAPLVDAGAPIDHEDIIIRNMVDVVVELKKSLVELRNDYIKTSYWVQKLGNKI